MPPYPDLSFESKVDPNLKKIVPYETPENELAFLRSTERYVETNVNEGTSEDHLPHYRDLYNLTIAQLQDVDENPKSFARYLRHFLISGSVAFMGLCDIAGRALDVYIKKKRLVLKIEVSYPPLYPVWSARFNERFSSHFKIGGVLWKTADGFVSREPDWLYFQKTILIAPSEIFTDYELYDADGALTYVVTVL